MLSVRLTPRAAKDSIDGTKPAADRASYLAARVRAVPEKGAANAALERLVANWIGEPISNVTVIAGRTSRLKTVFVMGDPRLLSERLADLAQI